MKKQATMSELDKICEQCDKEFTSFIETICDDCHTEHEKNIEDRFKHLQSQLAIAKSALEGIGNVIDHGETDIIRTIKLLVNQTLKKLKEAEG